MSWRGDLGEALRDARIAAGLTQEDVAAALGVRQSSVSQVERGATAPRTRHLLTLLRLFGRPLVDMLIDDR